MIDTGNFGVATSFLFRARPVGTVYDGPIFRAMDKGSEVLRSGHDFILEAPEDTNGWFGPPFKRHAMRTPGIRPVCSRSWVLPKPWEHSPFSFRASRNKDEES